MRHVQHFPESVIRETTRIAQCHGAINIGQGIPDFDPPEEVKEAACRAIHVSTEADVRVGGPTVVAQQA